jgi:M3 family oligoendopeptidase
MKFNEYHYERPDRQAITASIQSAMEQLKVTTDLAGQTKIIDAYYRTQATIETMVSLAQVRASQNITDTFYDQERSYWDETLPLYQELSVEFNRTMLASPLINELREFYPPQLFTMAEFSLKGFHPDMIPMLQEENRLTSKYSKLIASAQIEFEGKTYSLAQLTPFTQSEDRALRERAVQARMGYFTAHEAEIDQIYHELVQVRHQMAGVLGLPSFTELGYIRMMRSDYNAQDVERMRQQVLDVVVPLATKLYQRQAARLGYDKLRYFDEKFEFLSGNAKPKGSAHELVEQAKAMYQELSPETHEFFTFMTDRELLDLEARPNKESGGYCTFFPDYASPFIFSNFNGTSGDVDVLTHEAGHAFQCYQSRHIPISSCVFPTYESAEIHSMSMEFFTWPWMDKFFHEEADKYRFAHLSDAVKFIPYGTLVDAFQHEVYAHPEWTPEERKATWRRLERAYLPHKDYEGCSILERGGWWFQQGHIFNSPFYYIDYVLAQMCALEFWKKMHEDRSSAWNDYLNLCQAGGQYSFLKLVAIAKLHSPFQPGALKRVITPISNWLDQVDDRQF